MNKLINYDIEEKYNIINYIPDELCEDNKLPNNITISTISISAYIGTKFNMYEIENYMPLDEKDIIQIKSKNNIRRIEDMIKAKNIKKPKKNFYNQLTTVINVNKDRYINIKLFKNGSIQLTGCKSLEECNIGINKLFNKMKEIYSYIDDNDEFVDINFVENVDNIEISKMKIVLINSNFTINYKINREILVNLLNNEHITYKYEPSSHAAVNIKYKCNNRIVSILVFQTGNIIITGAKKISQIIESYRYIHTYLQKNKTKIIKKDINTLLSKEDYNKIIMKNNNTDDLDDEDNNDDNDVKLINNL